MVEKDPEKLEKEETKDGSRNWGKAILKIIQCVILIALPSLLSFPISALTSGSIDSWYKDLKKPVFNPPNWVFGPVWTTLYLLMGTASMIIFLKLGWVRRAILPMGFYFLQLLLNCIWTPIFFEFHQIGLAWLELNVLYITVIATMVTFWKVNKIATVLLIPYIMWLSLAWTLNISIYYLNEYED